MNTKQVKKTDKPEKQTQKPTEKVKSKLDEVADSTKKPKNEKKQKKSNKKDDGVKRAKSAYNCFCEEQRPKYVKENPEAGPKDIMKILGDGWKNISDVEKKKYDDLAAKDKERFLKEKKEAGGEGDAKKDKKKTNQSKLIF
jgi:structure-specific recognition protein 1